MLKHQVISKITFHGYQIALVEDSSDYIVAKGYKGHKEPWEQGEYFPKRPDDMRAREMATNTYLAAIEKEIKYWL